jgi:hypothetical protein
MLKGSRVPMQMRANGSAMFAPATKGWSRSRARSICPRRHLRVLPIRTRPSLFGGD